MINEHYHFTAVVPGDVEQIAGRLSKHYGGEVTADGRAAMVEATRGSSFISFDSLFSIVPFLGLAGVFFQKWNRHRVRIRVTTAGEGEVEVDWQIDVFGGAAYVRTTPPLVAECQRLAASLAARSE